MAGQLTLPIRKTGERGASSPLMPRENQGADAPRSGILETSGKRAEALLRAEHEAIPLGGGGDINAFFGLMLDNVAVMVLLFGMISSSTPVEQQEKDGQILFTPAFVLTRMIPGTALGVLLGDLVYTVLAFRLARRGSAATT